jgi:hypothetical protein
MLLAERGLPARRRGRSGAGRRVAAAALAAVCLPVLIASCASARTLRERFPYAAGERVAVQGVIADAAGAPVGDVEVVLEASRLGFGFYPPGERKREVVTGRTRADRSGNFGLELSWSRRYNHFELVVGVPLVRGGAEVLHELVRLDVTRRLRQGSPVVLPVTLQDTSFLTNLRTFLAHADSADELRVYREAGKPDRVDTVSHPDREEAAWWYFADGKVYRFRDGRLDKVEEFAPVRPL